MGAEPTTVEPEVENRTALAPQWKVLLLDDDKTTFEFVIWLLRTLFHKSMDEAIELTWEIHESGAALVAVANFERAELYAEQVRSLARAQGFPLTAEIEPA